MTAIDPNVCLNLNHRLPDAKQAESNWQPYRRSCDQLGVCQRKTPPCVACRDEVDTCSVWEHMVYWLAVGAVSVATVGVLAGIAGYVLVRWL